MNRTVYMRILIERWKIVVVGLLLGVVVAGVVTLLVEPRYSAKITIFVSATSAERDATDAYNASLLSQERVRSYARLLTNTAIGEEVTRQLGMRVPPEDITDRITAQALPDTVLIDVSVSDARPEGAQSIVNAVGDALSRLVEDLEPREGNGFTVSARVIRPAGLPEAPISPNPVSSIALGTVLGLVVGCAAALLWTLVPAARRRDAPASQGADQQPATDPVERAPDPPQERLDALPRQDDAELATPVASPPSGEDVPHEPDPISRRPTPRPRPGRNGEKPAVHPPAADSVDAPQHSHMT